MKSKEQSLQLDEFKNQLLIEKEKIEKKRTIKSFIFLILISFFNFFNFQIYDIAKISKPSTYKQYYFYSISITIFFLSTALMSYLLINYKIYRHQKISLIISPILSIIMFVLFIEELGFEFDVIIYLTICLLLRSLRFILMVLGKLYMERLYVTQFKLLSFFGIFGIILSFIANFIDFSQFTENDSINQKLKNVFNDWNETNKYYFFGSIILWFIENHLIWFCISTFSPNHYIVFRNISSILVILKELKDEKGLNDHKTIISFFVLIGIFICGLIFNEIIIIRICKCEKNTAEELYKRQKEEYENNKTDASSDSKNIFSSDISDTNLGTINEM
jgi:hypothetical protein